MHPIPINGLYNVTIEVIPLARPGYASDTCTRYV